MTAEERKAVISFLKKDEIKNINMLNFMESYPVMSLERIGNSVLLRGVSDCQWVYVSSPDEGELKNVAEKLTEEDRALLFEAFSLAADDAEEADVGYAQDAQREVVLKR